MPHRLALVRAVAANIGRASTVDDVADATLKSAAEYLDAVTSSVWLVTDDGACLEMRYETNAHPDAMARFARVPMDAELPGPHVIASGEACFLESRAARDARWPLIAGTPTDSEAMVVLPLETGGRRLGVVSFGFPEARSFDDEDRVALLVVADQCAIGIDRARLYEQERTRTAAQRLLATISGVDPSMDWMALARHAVTVCAVGDVDTCGLYVREGHLVRRVALASQTYPELGDELVDHYPTPLGSRAGNATAIRTGEPTPVPGRRRNATLTASPAPGYVRLMSETENGPGWAFPLRERGVTFGSMLFLPRAEKRFDDDAVAVMEAAAERTANLLISASAFAEQRAAIEALHDVVLPGDLSRINGFELAARYVPLGSAGSIGGDWWDALALPDGRLAIAVGDVAGHGVPSAAIMGQVRNALRMALVSRREPAEALGEVSRYLDWIEPNAHCTAIAATADAANGRVTWTSAGHPPPLVIAPGTAPVFLAATPAPALGVVGSGTSPYSEQVVDLSTGSILVLYTDGLVEGRNRHIDDGLGQLADVAAAIPGTETLESIADRILAALVDRPDDDVCLLVMRRP
ncbi:MAG: SpoIIE family protein phosphatase [Actinobacteria bacterium]|nr:SpoIIE family protein phosphatase [Actinomycetota bacterium]